MENLIKKIRKAKNLKPTEMLSMLFPKGRSTTEFPLRHPIEYGGTQLGHLVIDFEPSIPKGISDDKAERLLPNLVAVVADLIEASPHIRSDIETGLELRDIYMAGKGAAIDALFMYNYEDPVATRWLDYLDGDEDLFALVRSKGIDVLRLPAAQIIITRWLVFPASLNSKFDKLKAALVDNSLNYVQKTAAFPKGRPKEEFVRILGESAVKEIYEDLTAFFSILNKSWSGEYQPDSKKDMNELRALFKESASVYVADLQEAAEREPQDNRIKNRLARIKHYADEKQAYRYALDCLVNNKDLLKYFNLGQFMPYELTLKIMEKLLGASRSTLKKFIYHPPQKPPKKISAQVEPSAKKP